MFSNQFHDVLPGSSIGMVYQDAEHYPYLLLLHSRIFPHSVSPAPSPSSLFSLVSRPSLPFFPLSFMIVILILGIHYETVATTANNVVASSIAALAPNKGGIGVVNTTSFDRREVVELPAGVRTPQVSHDGKPLGMPERVRG